ncbi:MAG: protein translocase subunit SecDF [Lewinellaceae bacterium]|nr:protein translocase subunit SecDF [Lewinellaceae bacterium]
MQGKGIIRFFLVLMTLVTLIQFLFTLPTRKVEKAADAYAQAASNQVSKDLQNEAFKQKRAAYLDSMSSVEVMKIPLLKSYTYQELKSNQLALGLDLKGGMSVLLQVDLRDFIRALANDSTDPTFLAALDKAAKAQATDPTDYVTLFANFYRESGQKLAPLFARNEALREQINYETGDGEVVRVLRDKANETVDLTFKLLKERIDRLGVTQPNVSLDASRDLILVELPGIDNPERARNFLQAAAKLEFWNVYRITDPVNPNRTGSPSIQQAMVDANAALSKTLGDGELEKEVLRIDTTYVTDSTGTVDKSQIAKIDTVYSPVNIASGPLFSQLTMNATGEYGLAVIGVAEKNKRAIIDTLLERQEVRALFPREIAFRWSRDPIVNQQTGEETNLYQLYTIKKEREEPPVSGDRVVKANADPDPITNEPGVTLQMDKDGAKSWAEMTTKAAQDNKRQVAILLDDEVVSAPSVNEPITGGSTRISGSFTIQDAQDLANILEIGKLPAETKILSESLVGPSLGKENIAKSIRALVIGFVVVMGFMLLYYSSAGIISIISLLLNLFFIFGALSSFGTVLTLPGIAGIVLTIGMAVDANVIIYERIREELRDGKSILTAIADGFKNSYSAIIDANVTTILTAMMLAYFGLGPIKGFAVVLMIGVISSLFTAVLVSRLLIDWWTNKGRDLQFSSKISENTLANINFDWMGKRKLAYMFSGTLILLSIIGFAVRGFELGVDFKGGYSYNITFAEAINPDQLRSTLTQSFEGNSPVVKAIDTENTYNVVTSYLVDSPDEDAPERVITKLHEGINTLMGGKVDFENFKQTDGEGTHVTSSSQVGPTVADDIKESSVEAAVFALLLIFLYIFLRFSKWQYSVGAVAALFHDTIITLGVFAWFHGVFPFTMEIDQAFIAAILTVIGYSINDTVVVFDRIREFLNNYTRRDKIEVINMAINSTLSRTTLTSMTTLFVVIVLFVFGGTSIKGFAFAILVGIGIGTYSSIFVASPIMADLTGGEEMAGKSKTDTGAGKGFSKAAKTK